MKSVLICGLLVLALACPARGQTQSQCDAIYNQAMLTKMNAAEPMQFDADLAKALTETKQCEANEAYSDYVALHGHNQNIYQILGQGHSKKGSGDQQHTLGSQAFTRANNYITDGQIDYNNQNYSSCHFKWSLANFNYGESANYYDLAIGYYQEACEKYDEVIQLCQ